MQVYRGSFSLRSKQLQAVAGAETCFIYNASNLVYSCIYLKKK